MDKDVLTTTQAARLMGISVRTAQLLIESNALTSWKTPGGHRRVYREDVLALMTRADRAPRAASALVTLVASPARRQRYEALLSEVRECTVDAHDDVYTAAFAMGSNMPAAVVLDVEQDSTERLEFVRHLAGLPALGRTRFIVVGGGNASAPDCAAHRLTATATGSAATSPTAAVAASPSMSIVHLPAAEQLPEAIRAALREPSDPEKPATPSSRPSLSYPIAANENQRLAALERSGLLDTPAEEAFDRLTWLASRSLKAPIALMTMLTPTRQWFKSRVGLDMTQTPRSWAFCNDTILQRGVFAVDDLAREPRFAGNPAVANAPYLRFYAGAPVLDADGFALGSLCVMDYAPRHLDPEQKQTLRALAALASDEVRLRATDRQLRWTRDALNRERKH